MLNPTNEQLRTVLEVDETAVGSWKGPKRNLNALKLRARRGATPAVRGVRHRLVGGPVQAPEPGREPRLPGRLHRAPRHPLRRSLEQGVAGAADGRRGAAGVRAAAAVRRVARGARHARGAVRRGPPGPGHRPRPRQVVPRPGDRGVRDRREARGGRPGDPSQAREAHPDRPAHGQAARGAPAHRAAGRRSAERGAALQLRVAHLRGRRASHRHARVRHLQAPLQLRAGAAPDPQDARRARGVPRRAAPAVGRAARVAPRDPARGVASLDRSSPA